MAVFAAAWFFSPAAFKALIAAAFMIAMGEWLLMLKVTPGAAGAVAVISTVVLATCAFYDIRLTDTVYTGLMLVVSCLWLALTAVLFAARNLGFRIKRTVSLVFAVLFPVSAWFAFERMTATGLVFMLSVFAVIWLADICAYFCGRLFGKRKMAPAISPGKTWAGAVGAVVFVFAFAIIAAETLPHDMIFTSVVLDKMGYAAGFAAVLLLVAVSIAGDLFESAVKRQAGVKDSSNLLPGHGGFFDRFDSSLAVFPTAAALRAVLTL